MFKIKFEQKCVSVNIFLISWRFYHSGPRWVRSGEGLAASSRSRSSWRPGPARRYFLGFLVQFGLDSMFLFSFLFIWVRAAFRRFQSLACYCFVFFTGIRNCEFNSLSITVALKNSWTPTFARNHIDKHNLFMYFKMLCLAYALPARPLPLEYIYNGE